MLTIEAIPAFDDNYIWCVYHSVSKQALVVDPGEAQPVLDFLQQRQLNLSHILITHHHYDHVNGLALLKSHYHAQVYGPHNPFINGIDHYLKAGDRIELLNSSFEVLEVPGHTLDHIAYFSPDLNSSDLKSTGLKNTDQPNQPRVFCGDTLFAGGCGRIFEGDPAMLQQSLAQLAKLPAETLVYCAHEYTLANLAFAQALEPSNSALQARIAADSSKRQAGQPTVPSSLALELATNPFLRCQSPELIRSAEQYSGRSGLNRGDTFAVIRDWKNHF